MLKKNQKGFGALEGLLILVIIGIIGFVGWYVWNTKNKTDSTYNSASRVASSTISSSKKSASSKNSATSTDPYTGWQSYSDSFVSFKYPADWKAGIGADKYAKNDVSVTSPGFTSDSMTTSENPGSQVTLYLQLSTDSSTVSSSSVYCNGNPCQISAVTTLNNSQLPSAALALVDQTSGNGTQYTQYIVVSGGTKVGDTTFTPLKIGSSNIYIFGQPYYTPSSGGPTMAAKVNDAVTFQTDSHFKDLVSLINSTKFN